MSWSAAQVHCAVSCGCVFLIQWTRHYQWMRQLICVSYVILIYSIHIQMGVVPRAYILLQRRGHATSIVLYRHRNFSALQHSPRSHARMPILPIERVLKIVTLKNCDGCTSCMPSSPKEYIHPWWYWFVITFVFYFSVPRSRRATTLVSMTTRDRHGLFCSAVMKKLLSLPSRLDGKSPVYLTVPPISPPPLSSSLLPSPPLPFPLPLSPPLPSLLPSASPSLSLLPLSLPPPPSSLPPPPPPLLSRLLYARQ